MYKALNFICFASGFFQQADLAVGPIVVTTDREKVIFFRINFYEQCTCIG